METLPPTTTPWLQNDYAGGLGCQGTVPPLVCVCVCICVRMYVGVFPHATASPVHGSRGRVRRRATIKERLPDENHQTHAILSIFQRTRRPYFMCIGDPNRSINSSKPRGGCTSRVVACRVGKRTPAGICGAPSTPECNFWGHGKQFLADVEEAWEDCVWYEGKSYVRLSETMELLTTVGLRVPDKLFRWVDYTAHINPTVSHSVHSSLPL